MRRLRDYGVIASFADVDALPIGVLEDARLLMQAEDEAALHAK